MNIQQNGRVTRKNAWLISLSEQGLVPTIRFISKVSAGDAYDEERAQILLHIADGHKLTNGTCLEDLNENLTIRVNTGLRDELEVEADARNMTIGTIVREALHDWLTKVRGEADTANKEDG